MRRVPASVSFPRGHTFSHLFWTLGSLPFEEGRSRCAKEVLLNFKLFFSYSPKMFPPKLNFVPTVTRKLLRPPFR